MGRLDVVRRTKWPLRLVAVAGVVAASLAALGACGAFAANDTTDGAEAGPATAPDGSAGEGGDADPGCNGSSSCAGDKCNAVGFGCVAAPPAGWNGPIVLFEGTNGVRPQCVSPFPVARLQGSANLDAGAPTCGCECKANACPPLSVHAYTDNTCGAPCGAVVDVPPGSCTSTAALLNNCPAGQIGIGVLDGGRLPADGCTVDASVSVPPLAWGTVARGCGASTNAVQGGCSAGQVCTSQSAAPFDHGVCVFQEGATSCASAGGYTVARMYYGDAADTRSCSACGCNIPVAQCALGGQVFQTSACSAASAGTSLLASQTCGAISGLDDAFIEFGVTATCTAQPGAPTGAATPTKPTMVCCLP